MILYLCNVLGGLREFVQQHQNLCEPACHGAKLQQDILVGTALPHPNTTTEPGECTTSVPNGPSVSEIIPRLFIGNKISAADEFLIDRLGIKYILNVTRDHPNYFQHRPDLVYKQICVNDSSKEDIGIHFEEALRFIGTVPNCDVTNYWTHLTWNYCSFTRFATTPYKSLLK